MWVIASRHSVFVVWFCEWVYLRWGEALMVSVPWAGDYQCSECRQDVVVVMSTALSALDLTLVDPAWPAWGPLPPPHLRSR